MANTMPHASTVRRHRRLHRVAIENARLAYRKQDEANQRGHTLLAEIEALGAELDRTEGVEERTRLRAALDAKWVEVRQVIDGLEGLMQESSAAFQKMEHEALWFRLHGVEI